MKNLRKDLFLALATFELALILVASILWFPVLVTAIVLAVFIFVTAEMVRAIVRMRKDSYDELQGKRTYKFPIWSFLLGSAMLLCLTAAIVLGINMLFGIMIIPIVLILVGLMILAAKLGINWLRFIVELIIIVFVIALIAYGVAQFVHSGASLNPGFRNDPVQDACEKGHNYVDGKCTVCEKADPDYKEPVKDPCEKGHNYVDGKCTVCEKAEPDYKEPVKDPCEKGHNYVAGKCTVCEKADPDYKATKINAPDTMKYGVPVSVKLEGIDADDLKYGNEDFISIVKVSDTEVVLTLVGIVNDEGKVEIVPASGYITVTDSVSGTNISIRIVE